MPVSRLLALMMFFVLFAGLALSQSQENNSADLLVFEGAASMNPAIGSADLKASPESPTTANQLSAKDHNLLADAREGWGNSNDSARGLPLGAEADRTCYFIRDYVVIRDSPHSDATHRDGSFNCVPGSRFRVYTTRAQRVKVEK
jgi:hypothetical protein